MKNHILEKIKTVQLETIDLIVVFFYCFFIFLLILSWLGFFDKYFIAGFLLFFIFFIFLKRKYITKTKNQLWFFIFVILLFVGLIIFKGYFSADALNYWLPWAREIVKQGKMPGSLMNISTFDNACMPFWPLLLAAVFSFFKFRIIFVALVPLFFIAATALFIYRWAKDKGLARGWLIFAVLLFLANPITLKYGWDLLQEAPFIFFFTAFFYYLEKHQADPRKVYLLLMLVSAVLAMASKLTGLVLVVPLVWFFIKKTSFRKKWPWAAVLFLPILGWFLRNYLIFDNPVIPYLNEIFRGRHFEIMRVSLALFRQQVLSFSGNVVNLLLGSLVLSFPFIWVAFYALWKEKKIQHLIVILLLVVLIGVFSIAEASPARLLYLLLGILLVYGLLGLDQIKSRLGLSLLFFLSLWGLLATKINLSQSQLVAGLEGRFADLIELSRFFHNYPWLAAAAMCLFFYFFISKKSQSKYLILLCWSFYLLKTSTLQISWLNIWLPILGLILVIFIWPVLGRFKPLRLESLVVGCIVFLLFLNSWGLALAFSFFHAQSMEFPRTEVYGILPQAGRQIEQLERANKDFYIYVASPAYLAWRYDFKVVGSDSRTLYYITKSRSPIDKLSAQEIRNLFKESQIKYIIENVQRPFWQEFFDKIRGNPEIFELILEKDGSYLWKVY